jgi:nicotinamidase-related amidase
MTTLRSRTALIVVDVQQAFDEWEAAGKRRNNPQAVARIADLLQSFRDFVAPIFHIRHEGTRPDSSFRPGGSGFAVKDEARERSGESVIGSTAPSSARIWSKDCEPPASRHW